MYYLKDVPFLDRKGEQVKLRGDDQTSVSLIKLVVGGWQPSRDIKESNLTAAQTRIWQKLMDDLDKGPTDGYLALEDDRFALVKHLTVPFMLSPNFGVVSGNSIASLAHYVPQMEDFLGSVSSTKPEVSPNGVPAEAKEQVSA